MHILQAFQVNHNPSNRSSQIIYKQKKRLATKKIKIKIVIHDDIDI